VLCAERGFWKLFHSGSSLNDTLRNHLAALCRIMVRSTIKMFQAEAGKKGALCALKS
jgi:hypothetical protein